MPEPTFDKDGYPTEATLRRIRRWKIEGDGIADCAALLEYVHKAWHWPDWGWHEMGVEPDYPGGASTVRIIEISTGGWSGNEDLISAMRSNFVFWALCWHAHRRGGHFTLGLRLPAQTPDAS